jgi:hypothetical protein
VKLVGPKLLVAEALLQLHQQHSGLDKANLKMQLACR